MNEVTKIKHSDQYLFAANLIPESISLGTFFVKNYFKIYLNHDNTTFSNGSVGKYCFQLIQPSLVQGVIDVPPPLFVDSSWNVLDFTQPVHEQPAQEVLVQGIVMDNIDDGEGKVEKADKTKAAGEETKA